MSISSVAAPSAVVPRRQWPKRPQVLGWRPVWSTSAALRAVRATLVVPALFALAFRGIGNTQMATFAAFGGFATLLFASFGGTRRDKAFAHLLLAVLGSLLVVIGTAVSSSTVVAATVTLPVAFLVLFAGILGPNAASGATAAMLAYVLPAASPGTISMIPSRLEGWWLASAVGTIAVLALSARSAGNPLRAATSKCADALADEFEAVVDGQGVDDGWTAVVVAKQRLLAAFTATPFRPTGLAAPDQALANVVEVLEWCTALVGDIVHEAGELSGAASIDRDLLAATAGTLRAVAALVGGGDGAVDLERLEELRAASIARLYGRASTAPDYHEAVHLSFHARTVAWAAHTAAADALIISRRANPATIAALRCTWIGKTPADQLAAEPPPDRRWLTGAAWGGGAASVTAAFSVAARHASIRSVWFLNSVRGAVALAAAVAVADLTNVQHGFWVVLGTLSVLRSNASTTGATALRAVAGTVVGFAIGAALILVIGTNTDVLWVVFPVAVLVAGYAPGTAPFAVGQAAFTVVIAVLFNLVAPVGWTVGEVRVEDVALGCAISVAVGVLFWPRGAARVVGDDLAEAYRHGAVYLDQAARWALGLRAERPDAAAAALTAGVRLDDALRGFMTEQGGKRVPKEDLWRLVGGAMRLRITANSLEGLPAPAGEVDDAGRALGELAQGMSAWYELLAGHLGRAVPPILPALVLAPEASLASTISVSPAEAADPAPRGVCSLWVRHHLSHLHQHHRDVIQPAAKVAEQRQRPWWR